jgi:cytochrome c-type biogenesis protein
MAEASLIAAFLAGLASFVSPCVLPLIPSFLSYLGGSALGEESKRGAVFLNSLSFVLGLMAAMAGFGILLGWFLGSLTGDALILMSKVSGALMVLFGLYILGFLRLGFLDRHGITIIKTRYPIITSFIIGAGFALAWSPLMGAFLAFIISMSLTNPGESPFLFLSFAGGLGVPFLLIGATASSAGAFIKRHGREMAVINRALGLMVVLIGLLVLFAGML